MEHPSTEGGGRMASTDGVLSAFFECGAVLALDGLDLNLLLGDFFTKELDALCLLLVA